MGSEAKVRGQTSEVGRTRCEVRGGYEVASYRSSEVSKERAEPPRPEWSGAPSGLHPLGRSLMSFEPFAYAHRSATIRQHPGRTPKINNSRESSFPPSKSWLEALSSFRAGRLPRTARNRRQAPVPNPPRSTTREESSLLLSNPSPLSD
jgi:hypothetical protein